MVHHLYLGESLVSVEVDKFVIDVGDGSERSFEVGYGVAHLGPVPGEKYLAFLGDIGREDVVGDEEEFLLVVETAGLGSGYLGEGGGHGKWLVVSGYGEL